MQHDFSSEKCLKYFIGYLYDDFKIKPLDIMLPKKNVHVKRYDDQYKWMYFWIEDDNFLKKYNTFGRKLVLILKKNLIMSQSARKESSFENVFFEGGILKIFF